MDIQEDRRAIEMAVNTQREWQLQRAQAAFLSKALPETAYWSAIDVGSAGSAHQGMLRKARGVHPGIADFIVIWNGTTLWIETKAGTGLSEAQRLFKHKVTSNGHHWALARSVEDVEYACTLAAIPLRATVAAIRTRIEDQRSHLPTKRKPPARSPRPLNAMSLAAYRRANAKGLL